MKFMPGIEAQRICARFSIGLLIVLVVSSTGCSVFPFLAPSPTPTATATVTFTPTVTFTSTPIPPTNTPTITPTSTWIWQPAGNVVCPILLYHHIADIPPSTYYYTSVADFTAQMNSLHDWGYTAIPISLLVQAITGGAELPARPIVITFDDGDEDVYTNAFPLMKSLDYPGVMYIVSNRLWTKDYLNIDEITEMAAAGWEVGSHSVSHINLQDNPGLLYDEAVPSRKALQINLNLPVDTFAYPFGAATGPMMFKVSTYGYKAAVGLSYPVDGEYYNQGPGNLFYLSRIEVPYDATLDQFTALLPWSGPIQ